MKAVEYRYDKFIADAPGVWNDGDPFKIFGKWAVEFDEELSVRYDNGQLCTFRRKPPKSKCIYGNDDCPVCPKEQTQ